MSLDSTRRPRAPAWLVLGCTLIGAAVLRFAAQDGPYLHYDEPIATGVVNALREPGHWTTNWEHCGVPGEFRYPQFNFSGYHYAAFFFRAGVDRLPGEALAGWRSEREGVLVQRFFSALLATIAVGLGAMLAWRLTGSEGATVFAAASIGAAPLLVQDAHYARAEAFVTVLLAAAINLVWPGTRFHGWRTGAAGFMMGLLIATKISFVPLAWLPCVPALVAWRTGDERGDWMRLLRRIAAACVFIAAGFCAGVPFGVLEPRQFMHGIRQLQTQYALGHPPFSKIGGGAVWDLGLNYFVATLGWAVLICGAVGAGALVRRRQWIAALLLIGPVLITVVLFGRQTVFFERNLSHVLVPALVLAAAGASEIARSFPPGWLRRGTAGVAAVLVLYPSCALSWRMIRDVFPGRSEAFATLLGEDLQRNYAGARIVSEVAWSPFAVSRLASALERDADVPVIFDEVSYGNAWTELGRARVRETFELSELAAVASTLPDVPTCTLHAYHTPWHRFYLVRRKR